MSTDRKNLLTVTNLKSFTPLKDIDIQEQGINCLDELKLNKQYQCIVQEYERFSEGGTTTCIGSGDQILLHLGKKAIDLDEVDEIIEDHGNLYNYLKYWFTDINGDGDDYCTIIELNL